MLEYKVVLGLAAVIIGILSYIPYFSDIFLGKTKPHAFSWLIWSILQGTAFAAQIVGNGGAGAWITGVIALICFIVFILAVFKGEKSIPAFDWLCLFLALSAIGIWFFTKDPTASVALVVITDAIGFLPTFRKAYFKPHEETVITFAFSGITALISLFALENLVFITWFYPASLVLTTTTFVAFVLLRRKQMQKR